MITKYRVMHGLSYVYIGDDLFNAKEQFDRFANQCLLEESTHEITTEPFIMAISPDDGELVGTLYGATLEDYNGKFDIQL